MTLLDLLAKYGPYAFVLMGAWFSLAFVVAAWRVRRFRTRKCVLSLLGNAALCLLYLAVPLMQRFSLNPFASDWTQVLVYFTILIWMCMPVAVFAATRRRVLPTWRQAGYSRFVAVLFFRRPATTGPVEAVPPAEPDRRIGRLTNLLIFGIAMLLLAIIFLGDSLRPCAWLDTLTQYSGCVREVRVNGWAVDAIGFSPDGSTLATQGLANTPLQLYRLADGAALWTAASAWGAHGSLSFSPDGRTLASAHNFNKVSIWDWWTGKLQKELSTEVRAVQFSPDGQYLATGSDKSGIQLWRISDWTIARTLPAQANAMSFSPDGKLIAGAGVSQTLTIWKTEDGAVFRTLPGDGDVPYFIAYSPDGTKLASSSLLSPVQIWNIADGRLASTLPISNTKGMAFSPDGKYLLMADWRYPEPQKSVITLWRVSDGQLMLRMVETDGFSSDLYSVAFAPDGETFAYGLWEKVKIFRMPKKLQ